MNPFSTGFRRIRRASIVSAVSCLFLVLVIPAQATVYYVMVGGNNSNNGTSTNTPWADFSKLNGTTPNVTLQPGDTVFVGDGTWNIPTNNGVGINFYNLSGTAANPITISNLPGAHPLFLGDPVYGGTSAGISMNGCSYIRLHGLSQSNNFYGVDIQGCWQFELDRIDSRGAPAMMGYSNPIRIVGTSLYGWIHGCTAAWSVTGTPDNDAGHSFTVGQPFGLWQGNPDHSGWMIVESNYFSAGCHDAISIYGLSNVMQFNSLQNTNFIFRQDLQVLGARAVLNQAASMAARGICGSLTVTNSQAKPQRPDSTVWSWTARELPSCARRFFSRISRRP